MLKKLLKHPTAVIEQNTFQEFQTKANVAHCEVGARA